MIHRDVFDSDLVQNEAINTGSFPVVAHSHGPHLKDLNFIKTISPMGDVLLWKHHLVFQSFGQVSFGTAMQKTKHRYLFKKKVTALLFVFDSEHSR